jgi:lipopolysaccharide/colanic/teichoic acid biosynthesis glycosyltransferase
LSWPSFIIFAENILRKMNKRFLFVAVDIIILSISFLFFAWLKPGTRAVVLPAYIKPFVFFLLIWVISSLATKKYIPEKFKVKSDILISIIQANFFSLAVVTIFIYTFNLFAVSRFMLFGTLVLATVIEVFFAWVYNMIITSPKIDVENGKPISGKEFTQDFYADERMTDEKADQRSDMRKKVSPELLKLIESEFGAAVKDLLQKHIEKCQGKIRVVSTTKRFNIVSLPLSKYHCIINLHRINDIRWLNKFFETINAKLSNGGVFIGKVETYSLRKNRLLKKYLSPFNYIIYFFDFIFRRVFPKLPVLKRLYFWITRGSNRILSRAETLGRLYSCGFDVIDEHFINDELYFVASKIKEPDFPETPTYGPLVKLRRIGKGGEYFYVYKMRTMHPYSEYLQDYIYKCNNLDSGGKFKDDFRVHTIGKIMRKFWLDETPMLINILKGDMKLVGVRPLSSHYYDLYSDELKEKRIKHKPGLVPPFYVDLPKTLEEIQESEMRYLEAFEKSPIKTDIRYFFIAWRNIIFKNARSK